MFNIYFRSCCRAVLEMYKEFCYLVASLKNPSLIYHFLNLLNQQNDKLDEVNIFNLKIIRP